MKPLAEQSTGRIGLIGLGVLAFVAVLVGAASGLTLGASHYSAVLEHTGGLRVGEEVQVAGVAAGEVIGIELGNREVRVDFTVDDDITLGRDTRVEVKVATLLGTHFLLVSPRGGGRLPDNTVAMDHTKVPFNLQDVLDETVAELDDFDMAEIERSFGVLADTLDRTGDDLGPALDGVRTLSELVAARSDEIGALLRAAHGVARQLNSSSGDIVTLMREADVILDALRTRRATIDALLTDLTTLGRQLSGIIRDTKADLAPTLEDIDTVAALLEKHDAALGEALDTLAPMARYFANAAGTGSWLDQYAPGATPDNLTCALEGACG